MKKWVQQFVARPFVHNVAIVASGTAGASAITIAFTPIITRLYEPETIGVVGTLMSIISIMTPLAAFGYPMAIVLQKNDSDALGLVRLSLMISILTVCIMSLVLFAFKTTLIAVLNLSVVSDLLYLIPVVIFITTCLAVMTQWTTRRGMYKLSAKVAVAQSLVVNSAKVGGGCFSPTAAVLVLVTFAGNILHVLMLALGIGKAMGSAEKRHNKGNTLLSLAKRNIDFALFHSPQTFINSASQSLPTIMLASLFGPVSAGLFTLGRTVMALPSRLVAQSVGSVFYPRIVEASERGESKYRLIVKATIGLVGIGVLPFSIVFIIGPWLFGVVFGSEWVAAGEYARWLSVMLFFNFINRPCVVAVPVLGIQRGLLNYEIISTGLKILSLYLGFAIFNSDLIAIALFCVFGAMSYIALIAWVIWVARNSDKVDSDASEAS